MLDQFGPFCLHYYSFCDNIQPKKVNQLWIEMKNSQKTKENLKDWLLQVISTTAAQITGEQLRKGIIN